MHQRRLAPVFLVSFHLPGKIPVAIQIQRVRIAHAKNKSPAIDQNLKHVAKVNHDVVEMKMNEHRNRIRFVDPKILKRRKIPIGNQMAIDVRSEEHTSELQ